VTASYAKLVVAPSGCTIGTYVLTPGVSFAFVGTFFKVPVLVKAALVPDPFSLTVDIQIGSGVPGEPAFTIGPFTLYDTALHLEMRPNYYNLAFHGKFTIVGGTEVALEGSFKSDGSFTFSGKVVLNVSGFNLADVTVTASAEAGFKNPQFELAAHFDIPQFLTVDLTGHLRGKTDFELHGSADFHPGGFKVGQLKFDIVLNSSEQYFRATGDLQIGNLASGHISVVIENQDGKPAFYLEASVDVNLFDLITGSGTFIITDCSLKDCEDVTVQLPKVVRGQIVQETVTIKNTIDIKKTRAHIDANINFFGFKMGLVGDFDPSWGFSITCWGEVHVEKFDHALSTDWWVMFDGRFSITVTNLAPYVIASASFDVDIWYQNELMKQRRVFARVGCGFDTNPFHFWVKAGAITIKL